MRILYALTTTAFLLILAPRGNSQTQIKTEEHSCESTPWEPPACESAWQANISAVFLGLATDVHEEDVPIILDGEKAQTLRLRVTFRVEEAFIGVSEKAVTVTSGGDLCGFPFTKGHEYLVYGRRLPNDEVYVSISSSTKWQKDAAADLKYLRGLPTAPHGVTIYGTVLRYKTPQDPKGMFIRVGIPETGHKVEVEGASQTYEAIVDSRGNFRLSGLPAGRYKVLLNADGEVYTLPPLNSTTVDIADKGCARFGFWIDPFAKKESKTPDGQQAPLALSPKPQNHP